MTKHLCILALSILLPTAVYGATLTELQAQIAALMAQISALQTQTQSPVATTSNSPQKVAQCPSITKTLYRGFRSPEVTQLQQFLIGQGLLTQDSATGFFGALTEVAVQQFQCKHISLCSGSASLNGYGAVGPRTRDKIMALCSTVSGGQLQESGSGVSSPTQTIALPPTQTLTPVGPTNVAQAESTPVPGLFYVDNACAVNGNGTLSTCALTAGGNGAFNTLAAMTARPGGYAPGNQILLKRGLVFREMLVMPSSGSQGNPIRVGSYGDGSKPVILGSDTIKQWQLDTGNVHVASLNWSPNLVFQSDIPLIRATSRTAMSAGTFFVDTAAQKLYVWPRGNTMPSEGIEASRRPQNYYGLVMDGWTGNSWIEFDGIEVKNSNWMSFRIFGGKNVTIKNSVITNGFFNAIIAMGTGQGAATDPDGFVVTDNAIKNHGFARAQGHDGAAAISVDGADGFLIERNTVDTNYGEGIESYNTANNGSIQHNTVKNQQLSGAIYVNASFGRPTSNIVVKNNSIVNGGASAYTALTVAIEGTGSINSVTVSNNTVSGYASGGGLVVGSGAGTISNSLFENNTITSSLHGIEVLGSSGLTFSGNMFKNNTVNLASNGSALLVTEGGATGNTFLGNTFTNSGTTQPIFWLGKYYYVSEFQNILAGSPAVIVPAQPTLTTSCVYGSNNGSVTTLSATSATSCKSSCLIAREANGLSDGGACTFIDAAGITTATPIPAVMCMYSSNSGATRLGDASSLSSQSACTSACNQMRVQYFGASDSGVCIYSPLEGAQTTVTVP